MLPGDGVDFFGAHQVRQAAVDACLSNAEFSCKCRGLFGVRGVWTPDAEDVRIPYRLKTPNVEPGHEAAADEADSEPRLGLSGHLCFSLREPEFRVPPTGIKSELYALSATFCPGV